MTITLLLLRINYSNLITTITLFLIINLHYVKLKNVKDLKVITNFPTKNKSLPFAVIMVPNDRDLFYKSPMVAAFQIALDKIRTWNVDWRVKNLQYYSDADSDCKITKIALYYTVKLLTKTKPNVWFGPICDYNIAPIARLLPFWNIAMVTPGGASFGFHAKDSEYSTLTRTGPTILTKSFIYLFQKLFQHFNWSHVNYVYDTTFMNFCRDIGQFFDGYHRKKQKQLFQRMYLFNQNSLFKNEFNGDYAVIVLCVEAVTLRDIMLQAKRLNYVNGEYVFININLFGTPNKLKRPWYSKNDTDKNNQLAKEAFRGLLTVAMKEPEMVDFERFMEKVHNKSKLNDPLYLPDSEISPFIGTFHDSLLLYALALNDTLAANKSFTDGRTVTKMMWNRTFKGITGVVSIDANGDRNADYSLLDMDKVTGNFKTVATYFGKNNTFTTISGAEIDWVNQLNQPPPDRPICGFDNRYCPKNIGPGSIALIVMAILLLASIFAGYFVYRRLKFQAELKAMNWIISWNCIETKEKRDFHSKNSTEQAVSVSPGETVTKRFQFSVKGHMNQKTERSSLNVSLSSWESFGGVRSENMHCQNIFITTAIYKGNIVALKPIHDNKKIEINKALLIDVKKIKDLNNEHICRFIGVCLDAPNQSRLLVEYCPKGSLQDILENDHINLDWMFKYSLLQDICRGMVYIHSNIGPHGNLKSTNCLVDSRFVLKISDFGLEKLRSSKQYLLTNDKYAYYRHLLWTAPEVLRKTHDTMEGKTIKGDAYSFAIICQEVVYRQGVFFLGEFYYEPHEIIEMVQKGPNKPNTAPMRPMLNEDDSCSEELRRIVVQSWQEDPSLRPDFRTIKALMRGVNKGGDSGNILDNLLSRMEQYANNLEDLVNQRTEQYLEEKRKTEDLLYSMLPKSVAGQLIRNETVTAESFEMVSIYFSDIVGFTSLSAESTPMQVIGLLNRLYTLFDSIIEGFDVYKVETIGDAYMVCSGLPQRNGNIHIREIARMSLAFLSAIFEFEVPHMPGRRLELRIGIHSGPVCAGVVGLKMPRYCLFGDTVNTASRMESNGLPLKIHISQEAVDVLTTFQAFVIRKRGEISMKGKGYQTTYWLHGEGNHIIDPLVQTET